MPGCQRGGWMNAFQMRQMQNAFTVRLKSSCLGTAANYSETLQIQEYKGYFTRCIFNGIQGILDYYDPIFIVNSVISYLLPKKLKQACTSVFKSEFFLNVRLRIAAYPIHTSDKKISHSKVKGKTEILQLLSIILNASAEIVMYSWPSYAVILHAF